MVGEAVIAPSPRSACLAGRTWPHSPGPDPLKASGEPSTWKEIAGIFGHDAEDVEKARLRLTQALLSIANDSRHLDVPKRAARQRTARDESRRR